MKEPIRSLDFENRPKAVKVASLSTSVSSFLGAPVIYFIFSLDYFFFKLIAIGSIAMEFLASEVFSRLKISGCKFSDT